jgi:hypothetical protein
MEILKSIIFFSLTTIALSCKNTPHDQPGLSTVHNDSGQARKQQLVQEVNKLKIILASGDSNKIADLFPFPLADSVMPVYTDDSAYNRDYKKNGDRVTRDMFLKYYPIISQRLQVDKMNELFKYIKTELLLRNYKLGYDIKTKKEPCYPYYNIEVDSSNMVTFTTGTNSNPDYKGSTAAADEDVSDGCEYAVFWTFMFDGRKLVFVRETAAG